MTRPTNPLTIAKRTDGYYLLDPTGEILEAPCGSYETIAEARSDARGLWRAHKYGHRRSFWTADKVREGCRQLTAF